MLALLPLLTLGCLFIWLSKAHPTWGWRRSLLRSFILWGIWIVASTELLSLFEWITPLGLSLSWGSFLLLCIAGLARNKKPWTIRKPTWLTAANGFFLIPLAVIFLLTALVAWLAPPDIVDSLNYHLPRVAHWAQNRSVEHFATGIEQQNSRPPFAEYTMLHFYVLFQGDRLVNFVEWLAMFGSVIGISLVAAMLGAGTSGQFLAAVFAATLPMGIIQASSTMNDYVVGLWIVCVASELLTVWREPKPARLSEIVFLTSAAGLAIATKPTAYAYLFPFAIAAFVLLVKKLSPKKVFFYGAVGIAICVALNAGYMIRNAITYGNPIDPGQTAVHANEMLDWRGLTSNLMRNAGLHLSTPWQPVNYQITRLIQAVHFKMGLDMNDPRTTAHGEFWLRPLTADVPVNSAPNWHHAYLLGAIFIFALVRYKQVNQINTIYLLLVLATFIVFSFTFKWQIFGSRYHLPFFVLLGATAGVFLARLFPHWLGVTIGLILSLSTAWPLLNHATQPLLPLIENTTLHNATTASHPSERYPSLASPGNPYQQFAGMIQESGCQEVYIAVGGNSQEYYWWIVLGAPDQQMKIEWMVAGTPSAAYENASLTPCAVICEGCADRDSARGIPRAITVGGFELYLHSE